MVITLLMAVTEPLYALMAGFASDLRISLPGTVASSADLDLGPVAGRLAIIVGIVIIEQVCGGMATAAQMVFIMQRCHPGHRAAHFAFATAIYSIPHTILGGESGSLYEWVGPVSYFWIVSALTLPAILLARLVPRE
jgi:PAT family beta-lactamase induction signal transducer AmpG